MIERTLAIFPNYKIVATLHPKEIYSVRELNAVEHLERTYPNLEVRTGQMEVLLDQCAFVVTQNSSIAFNGYFFEKPAVLFWKIDFHHIALGGETIECVKWSGKFEQRAKMYLTRTNGYENDKETKLFRQI